MATRMRTFRLDGDAGTTILEVVVAMALMSVFGLLFTSAVVLMNGSSTKIESSSMVSSELSQAFGALDKDVRYAAAVSVPGQGGSGNWYVELAMTYSGESRCQQLRVDAESQQLQSRTWTSAGGTALDLTPWIPVASQVVNGSAPAGPDQPFIRALTGTGLQQLTVTLESGATFGGQQSRGQSSTTFTAVNSALASGAGVCDEVGRP